MLFIFISCAAGCTIALLFGDFTFSLKLSICCYLNALSNVRIQANCDENDQNECF